MAQRRFVLLDRDGTLIVEKHHLSDPDEVELIQGVGPALRRMRALDLGLVVVTNQSVIGRGMVSLERLDEIHARLVAKLLSEDVVLDGIFFCPHLPDAGCSCRKPRTQLAEQAARELDFDLGQSFMVGDMESDIGLGHALGSTTLLVRTGHGAATESRGVVRPDLVVDDLTEAADAIERILGSPRAATSP